MFISGGRDAVADVTESADKGYYLTKALLERTPEVTAFVCMNDAMALGAFKAVREAGKKCRMINPLSDSMIWYLQTPLIRHLPQ